MRQIPSLKFSPNRIRKYLEGYPYEAITLHSRDNPVKIIGSRKKYFNNFARLA